MDANTKAFLRAQLERHEGLRLTAYVDTTGNWTIGYGHKLSAGKDWSGLVWSRQQAEQQLDTDILRASMDAALLPTYATLNDTRQAVLINMVFNMGSRAVGRFMRMFAALRTGDFDHAADEMLNSTWARQVGGRATELAEQMRSGVLPQEV